MIYLQHIFCTTFGSWQSEEDGVAAQDPTLMLVGSTKATIDQVKAAARRALETANRTGTSAGRLLAGGGPLAAGKIRVAEEKRYGLSFAVYSVGGRVELSTFDLEMEETKEGTQFAVVFQSYREHQSKTLGFIPLGPKYIMGFDKYTAFLDDLSDEICGLDSEAEIETETVS